MILTKISVSILLALLEVGVLPANGLLRGGAPKTRRLDHEEPEVHLVIDGDACPGETVRGTMTVHGAGGTTTTIHPMDVVTSIDTSGSMNSENKLANAKAAAINFVTQMAAVADSMAGVVGWHSSAHTLVPLTQPPNAPAVVDTINGFSGGGMTDINDGLGAAVTIHLSTPRPPGDPSSKAIILLTDGRHNQGPYNPCSEPTSAAAQARDAGIKVFGIGVGSNADESALNDMASCTGGDVFLGVDPANIAAVFDLIYKAIVTSTVPANIDVKIAPSAYGVDDLKFDPADPHVSTVDPALVENIDDGLGLDDTQDWQVGFEAKIALHLVPQTLIEPANSYYRNTDMDGTGEEEHALTDAVLLNIDVQQCCMTNHMTCGKDNNSKIWLCHIPPGNEANMHNICISPNALPDHLQEHVGTTLSDYCGDCLE